MENEFVGMVVRVCGKGVGEVVKHNPFTDEVIVKMDDEINVMRFTKQGFLALCTNIDFDPEGWI